MLYIEYTEEIIISVAGFPLVKHDSMCLFFFF